MADHVTRQLQRRRRLVLFSSELIASRFELPGDRRKPGHQGVVPLAGNPASFLDYEPEPPFELKFPPPHQNKHSAQHTGARNHVKADRLVEERPLARYEVGHPFAPWLAGIACRDQES